MLFYVNIKFANFCLICPKSSIFKAYSYQTGSQVEVYQPNIFLLFFKNGIKKQPPSMAVVMYRTMRLQV